MHTLESLTSLRLCLSFLRWHPAEGGWPVVRRNRLWAPETVCHPARLVWSLLLSSWLTHTGDVGHCMSQGSATSNRALFCHVTAKWDSVALNLNTFNKLNAPDVLLVTHPSPPPPHFSIGNNPTFGIGWINAIKRNNVISLNCFLGLQWSKKVKFGMD